MPEKPPLHYAVRVGEYREPKPRTRYPLAITLTVLVGAILFTGHVLTSLVFMHDLGKIAGLMLATAAIYFFAILSPLARSTPAFTFGAILIGIVSAGCGLGVILSKLGRTAAEQNIIGGRSGVVIVYDTSTEGITLTAWNYAIVLNAAGAIVAFAIFVYLVARGSQEHAKPKS